jgi:trehalose-phosphatase
MREATRIGHWLADWLADGGHLLLLTDYDGTLTPIVPRPGDAWLPEEVREDLQALARVPRIHVGVVSGRDLADLRERVVVPEAVYAGCHGLEIEGPGMSFSHPVALAQQETLIAVGVELSLWAPTVPGLRVELKRFGVAIHYRHVAEDQIQRVEQEVADANQQHGSRLKISHGAKVIEVQPRVGWTKGSCVRWIREAVRPASPLPLVLYMGDDWTDERAFEALVGQAITIRVGAAAPASHAAYQLPDVADAQLLLRALAAGIRLRGVA